MNELNPDPGAKRSARRKLVKGVFAAPAMLTLHSGGAAASSLGTCLAKRNLSPIGQPHATSASDIWFRLQLWGWVKNGAVFEGKHWIQGSDLTVFKRKGIAPWLASGSFQRYYLAQTGNYPVDTLHPTAETTKPSCNVSGHTWQSTGKWVSLRVDKDGGLVGAGSTGAGSAVSDSCWSSFAAAAGTM